MRGLARATSLQRALLLTVLATVGAVFVLWFHWPCPIRTVLKVPCPSCGITRALKLALRGQLAEASAMHPGVWVAVPVVAILGALEVTGFVRTGAWGGSARLRGRNAILGVTVALLALIWLLRATAGAFGGLARVG